MSGFGDRRRARALLVRAFDGTLDAEGWLELEALAARDARIGDELARQQRLVEAFEGLDEPEAEPFDADAFTVGVLARLDGEDAGASDAPARRIERRPVLPFTLAVAAAAALLAFVVFGPGDDASTDGRADGRTEEVARGPRGADGVNDAAAPSANDNGSPATDGAERVAPDQVEFDARPLDAEERAARRAAMLEALAAAPDPDGSADWARGVRRSVERAAPGGATSVLRDLLERGVAATEGDDAYLELALVQRATAWLVDQRDARTLELVDDRLAGDGSGDDGLGDGASAELRAAVRAAVRDGWLASATTDDVAAAARSGRLGAVDTDEVRAFVRACSAAQRARFGGELLARGLDRVDPLLFAALCEDAPELVAATVDAVSRGRVGVDGLAAHRANTALVDGLTRALVDAPRGAGGERLVAACAALGSQDALPRLAQLCRAGRPGAAAAVVAIGGRRGVEVWIEVTDELSVAERVSGWRTLVAGSSADDLRAVAAGLDGGGLDGTSLEGAGFDGAGFDPKGADRRATRLLDGLILADDARAVAALLELATRDADRDERRAAAALGAAVELLARTPDASPAALALDERAFDRLADACVDLDLLARALVAFHLSFGPDAARAWCSERFDDVRPMDAFDIGRPESAATRARLRLFLERVLRDAARA